MGNLFSTYETEVKTDRNISILPYMRFSVFLKVVSWSTKIRPHAKIDNFAFKNSNIIIEELFWKRKD